MVDGDNLANNLAINNLIINNNNQDNKKENNKRRNPKNIKPTTNRAESLARTAVTTALEKLVLNTTNNNNNNNNNRTFGITKSQVDAHYEFAKRSFLQGKFYDFVRKQLQKDFKMYWKSFYVHPEEYSGYIERYAKQIFLNNKRSLENFINLLKIENDDTRGILERLTIKRDLFFTMRYNKENHIVIRCHLDGIIKRNMNGKIYTKFFEWTYYLQEDEEILRLLSTIPNVEIRFTPDIFSKFQLNGGVSMKIMKVLNEEFKYKKLSDFMREAKYPIRLWSSTILRARAQNNAAPGNTTPNFSGSKLERVGQFLTKVDDLFASIAQGKSNITEQKIPNYLQLFELRATSRTLAARAQVANQLLAPLQKAQSRKRARLEGNLTNTDKAIVALTTKFNVDRMLTVIQTDPGNVEIPGIRTKAGEDRAIIIRKKSSDPGYTIIIDNLSSQGQVQSGRGVLSEALKLIVDFCVLDHLRYLPPPFKSNSNVSLSTIITRGYMWLYSPKFKQEYSNFTTKKFNELLTKVGSINKDFKKELFALIKYLINRYSTNPTYKWVVENYDFNLVKV